MISKKIFILLTISLVLVQVQSQHLTPVVEANYKGLTPYLIKGIQGFWTGV